jgi:hypothetical protein
VLLEVDFDDLPRWEFEQGHQIFIEFGAVSNGLSHQFQWGHEDRLDLEQRWFENDSILTIFLGLLHDDSASTARVLSGFSFASFEAHLDV